MIKRPLDVRFGDAVRAGVKVTTIREKAWTVCEPIMLYHWSGKPYRSKHVNVASIVVEKVSVIWAERLEGYVSFRVPPETVAWLQLPMWKGEGFVSEDDMQAWFLKKMEVGERVTMHLMKFNLYENNQ